MTLLGKYIQKLSLIPNFILHLVIDIHLEFINFGFLLNKKIVYNYVYWEKNILGYSNRYLKWCCRVSSIVMHLKYWFSVFCSSDVFVPRTSHIHHNIRRPTLHAYYIVYWYPVLTRAYSSLIVWFLRLVSLKQDIFPWDSIWYYTNTCLGVNQRSECCYPTDSTSNQYQIRESAVVQYNASLPWHE